MSDKEIDLPEKWFWKGKDIDTMSEDELRATIKELFRYVNKLRGEAMAMSSKFVGLAAARMKLRGP